MVPTDWGVSLAALATPGWRVSDSAIEDDPPTDQRQIGDRAAFARDFSDLGESAATQMEPEALLELFRDLGLGALMGEAVGGAPGFTVRVHIEDDDGVRKLAQYAVHSHWVDARSSGASSSASRHIRL